MRVRVKVRVKVREPPALESTSKMQTEDLDNLIHPNP